MHESPPSSISNTQENPPKPNLESAKWLCDRKGTLETISPPTYNEATALNSKVNVCPKLVYLFYPGQNYFMI